MRFECNCTNEAEFRCMVDEIRDEKCGFNFEIGARLWYTPEGFDKSIMVEYEVATKDNRELLEDDNAPDWLTAYEVNNEEDDDCSDQIDTETIDSEIRFDALEKTMLDFAKKIFEECYDESVIKD